MSYHLLEESGTDGGDHVFRVELMSGSIEQVSLVDEGLDVVEAFLAVAGGLGDGLREQGVVVTVDPQGLLGHEG